MKITDEMIINYLDGELNISDKELFEEELKKNPSLQKQVRLFKEGDEMFETFSKDYFSKDDIDYEKLKKIALSDNKKTNNLKNEVYKKFKFKDLLFGLSFPQVSGVIASFLIAYMVGVYAPIGIFQQPSTWTLVKQNYKAVNDNISESNVREWQVQDEGVLLSLKAIPGLDVSKSIYLDNNGVITQGYKVALFIKSSKHNLIVSHKNNQYNVTRFKDLQVILNTEKGRNDIFLIVQKSGKEKLLKFTFNIIEEKK